MAFGYIEQNANMLNSDPTEAASYRSQEQAYKIKEIQFVKSRATELGQTNKKSLVNHLNVTLYLQTINGKQQ